MVKIHVEFLSFMTCEKYFRARLKAKREALRDANVVQLTASPVANGTFVGTRNGNKISYNRTRAAARAKLEATLRETVESDSEYTEPNESAEIKEHMLPTRRRGRHRRDIYSPNQVVSYYRLNTAVEFLQQDLRIPRSGK